MKTHKEVEVSYSGKTFKAMSIDGQTWSAFAFKAHKGESWKGDDAFLAEIDSSKMFQTICRLAAEA